MKKLDKEIERDVAKSASEEYLDPQVNSQWLAEEIKKHKLTIAESNAYIKLIEKMKEEKEKEGLELDP
jgi:hypothetical protein